MDLQDFTLIDLATELWTANLTLNINKGKDVYGGSTGTKKLPIQLTLNPVTRKITACSAFYGAPLVLPALGLPNLVPLVPAPFPLFTNTKIFCPPGQVVTGIEVKTNGTCHHDCDLDGPIISDIQLLCAPL